ncbi:hypothetical protein DPMN_009323 [Dreissena polymorpha]|uniref:Uncharacterized protein n=1 Tax=Dreissena polymorpha TaxID=45954 RepID=A0A9D4RY39_DREPO|nr:hypothetical protein DPMN_009323 [Dreissena polymorpha]
MNMRDGGQHSHGKKVMEKQLEQQQCRHHYERREARKSDQLQVLWSNPVYG